jgi:putative transcriptional regulator
VTTPIANRVRELREARGLTQGELGEAIGVTRQTIAAIERHVYSPSMEAAFRLARRLDCPVETLFVWRDD